MGSCPISVEDVTTVDVHAAKGLVGSGHRYLDVRTVEEFKKGHLENSLNVPFMFFTPQGRVRNPEFVEQVSSACDKEDEILVGCQSGVRSLQAAADLRNAGFKNVKNVGGGIAAWLENGFPVKKPEEKISREVKNQDFVEQVSSVCNKEDQIVVGCQSGVRSLQATTDLLKAGFKNVKNMGGGYAAWVENGFGMKRVEEEL